MPQVPEPVASLLFFDHHSQGQLKLFKFKDNVRQWVKPRVEAWKDDFPGERNWPQEWDEDKEAWKAARERLYQLHDSDQKGKASPGEVISALFPQDSEGPAARDIREQMFPGAAGDSSSPTPSTTQTPTGRNVTTPTREDSPDGASTPKPTIIISRSREGDDASLLSDSPSRQPNTPSRQPNTPSRGIISRIRTWATPTQHDRDPSPSRSPVADVSSSIDDSTHNDSGVSREEHEESMTTIGGSTPAAEERPGTTIDPPKEAVTQAPAQLSNSSPTRLNPNDSGAPPTVQETQTNETRQSRDISRDERSVQSQIRTVRARAPPRPGASQRTKSPSPRTAQFENKVGEGLTATAPNTEITSESHLKTAKARSPPRRAPPSRRNRTPAEPDTTDPEKGHKGVESKGQTQESSESMQERLDQQQQQIAALKEMIKNLSITQPQGQVLTRTRVKVIPTNYNRFYLPTGENKPIQLSRPQRAHRLPNFNPTQWFGDEKIKQLQERMRGALDKNYLAINYLRPENFSQCSSIQTDVRYWFHIPDPDVTPSYVAARASGEVDENGRLLADDGLPVNNRRYVWACAFGINKKNQLALEMEGLDGRPFSRCRTTNDADVIGKFKDLTDDHSLRWVTNKELQNLAKEEVWINRQLVGPDNGSLRPDRAYELIVWNEKEERPCFKWAPLADLQKRFGADMKEMIQNVAARKVDQPDIW